MRSKRNRMPRWSRLNSILFTAVGGLVLAHNLHLTPTEHKIALFMIIVVVYGLVGFWIKSNAAALQNLDDMEYCKQSRDPAIYGTSKFPTRTQAHFKNVLSIYRNVSSGKR